MVFATRFYFPPWPFLKTTTVFLQPWFFSLTGYVTFRWACTCKCKMHNVSLIIHAVQLNTCHKAVAGVVKGLHTRLAPQGTTPSISCSDLISVSAVYYGRSFFCLAKLGRGLNELETVVCFELSNHTTATNIADAEEFLAVVPDGADWGPAQERESDGFDNKARTTNLP